MPVTTPPTITPPPDAPQRGDRTTFSSRVDAFITWMVNAVTEFGAVADNVADNATDAAASATSAATSLSNATTQATAAATQAGLADDARVAAETARAAAETAQASAQSAFDDFDDRYLGSKTSDPATDNDGNPLAAGAMYFNSTAGEMRVYSGSAWAAAYLPASGYATLNGAETLTNKTLTDSVTFFADEADPTKKLKFQVSGVAPGTTRTITVPDSDLTLGPSALALLSTTTVSTPVAAVDIGGFSAAYDDYLIMYDNVRFSGDTAFQLRFIKSGAAVTTATYHNAYLTSAGVTGGSDSGNIGSQLLGSVVGATAIHGGRLDVLTANTAGKSTVIGMGSSHATTSNCVSFLSSFESTAAVLQGIRLYPNNGSFTITAGTFKLYGVAKA